MGVVVLATSYFDCGKVNIGFQKLFLSDFVGSYVFIENVLRSEFLLVQKRKKIK